MADINKFTTKEVLNKVLLDSSGNAVEAFSHTTQEALNAALDTTNNRLNVSLNGGTISGDVTITGDLTVSPGSNTHAYDELINGMLEITDGTSAPTLRLTRGQSDNHVAIDGDADADDILGVLEFGAHDVTYTGATYQSGARIIAIADAAWDADHVNDAATALHFYTQIDGTGNGYDTYPGSSAKMVISSAGNVGIGNVTPGSFYNSKLVVGAGSGEENLTIYAGSSNASGLFFADGTSGNARFSGQVYYNHDTNKMQFATNYSGASSYSLTIDSNGRAGVNVSSPAQTLAVQGDTYDNIGILAGTDVFGLITCQGSDLAIKASNSNAIQFHAGGATRFKLDTNSRMSLSNNDGGTNNTLFGKNTGAAITSGGNYNCLFGHNAGLAVNTGDSSVMIGYSTGSKVTTASKLILIGDSAGGEITATGGSNESDGTVAIGHNALNALTSGSGCIAIGLDAGKLITGGLNTVVGYQAADVLAAGTSNTVIGARAMGAADGGEQNNVIIGADAGDVINDDAADGNVIIGHDADPSGSAGTNQIVIGQGATGTGNNEVALGNTSISAIKAQVASITAYSSDERTKKDIADYDLKGVDFIKDLNLKTYIYKNPADFPDEIRNSKWDEKDEDGNLIHKKPEDSTETQVGLIAQEVEEALKKHGIGNTETYAPTQENGIKTLTYGNLIFPLIKAVQELSARVEELEGK